MKRIIKVLIYVLSFLVYPFYKIYCLIFPDFFLLLRSQLIILDLKQKGFKVGKSLKVGSAVNFKVDKNSRVIIGNNVVLGDDVYINVRKGAELLIGDNVHINKGTRLSSFKSVIIKNDSLIASYCNILDHNHEYDLISPPSTEFYSCAPIVINEGVWLGTKVQINKGIEIGRFSIIAANSVLTKSIEESCIYGGIPAKMIKCLKR